MPIFRLILRSNLKFFAISNNCFNKIAKMLKQIIIDIDCFKNGKI